MSVVWQLVSLAHEHSLCSTKWNQVVRSQIVREVLEKVQFRILERLCGLKPGESGLNRGADCGGREPGAMPLELEGVVRVCLIWSEGEEAYDVHLRRCALAPLWD